MELRASKSCARPKLSLAREFKFQLRKVKCLSPGFNCTSPDSSILEKIIQDGIESNMKVITQVRNRYNVTWKGIDIKIRNLLNLKSEDVSGLEGQCRIIKISESRLSQNIKVLKKAVFTTSGKLFIRCRFVFRGFSRDGKIITVNVQYRKPTEKEDRETMQAVRELVVIHHVDE